MFLVSTERDKERKTEGVKAREHTHACDTYPHAHAQTHMHSHCTRICFACLYIYTHKTTDVKHCEFELVLQSFDAHLFTHTHTHAHAGKFSHAHAQVLARTHTRMQTHTFTHTHTHPPTHTRTHTHAQ